MGCSTTSIRIRRSRRRSTSYVGRNNLEPNPDARRGVGAPSQKGSPYIHRTLIRPNSIGGGLSMNGPRTNSIYEERQSGYSDRPWGISERRTGVDEQTFEGKKQSHFDSEQTFGGRFRSRSRRSSRARQRGQCPPAENGFWSHSALFRFRHRAGVVYFPQAMCVLTTERRNERETPKKFRAKKRPPPPLFFRETVLRLFW